MNQPQVYISPLPLKFLSHLPPHPTPLRGHKALGLSPVSYSKFPLDFCFTDGNVYVSVLVSQLIPPSPSSIVSTKQLVLKKRLIGAVISELGVGMRQGSFST